MKGGSNCGAFTNNSKIEGDTSDRSSIELVRSEESGLERDAFFQSGRDDW